MDHEPAKFESQGFNLTLYNRNHQTIVYFKGFIFQYKRIPEVVMTGLVRWPYRIIWEPESLLLPFCSNSRSFYGSRWLLECQQLRQLLRYQTLFSGQRVGGGTKGVSSLSESAPFKRFSWKPGSLLLTISGHI